MNNYPMSIIGTEKAIRFSLVLRGKDHCRRLCCFYCRPQSRRDVCGRFPPVAVSLTDCFYTREKDKSPPYPLILCSQFITEINYSFRSQQQMHPFSPSFVAALQGRRYGRNQAAVSLLFFCLLLLLLSHPVCEEAILVTQDREAEGITQFPRSI